MAAFKEKRDGFHLIYYELFENLVNLYLKYKKIPRLSMTKLDRILNDKEFRKKYNLKKYIDSNAENMISKCLKVDNVNTMMKNIEMLYNYIIEECGGFDIKNFRLRSEVK